MKKQDTTVKFGGRTLIFTVAVNTEEDAMEVFERIRVAAAGPKLRMAVVGGSILEGIEALALWTAAQKDVAAVEKKLGIVGEEGEN